MPRRAVLALALWIAAAGGGFASAQSTGDARSREAGPDAPSDSSATTGARTPEAESAPKTNAPPPWSDLSDRLAWPFTGTDDADGPINTDRPTFTPSNVTVPKGRWQIETGYTFAYQLTTTTRNFDHDFPEFSNRIGIADGVELRLIWLGQNYALTKSRLGLPSQTYNGPSPFELGVKWRLLKGDDKEQRWIPATVLITSLDFPLGPSPAPTPLVGFSPSVQLVYGWQVTKELGIAGSTAYNALSRPTNGAANNDSYSQYSQSLVAFYSPPALQKATGFFEWFDIQRVGSADDRPYHFMDGGLLYRPTDNTQFDIRAGYGLGGHNDSLFTGVGFSIRF